MHYAIDIFSRAPDKNPLRRMELRYLRFHRFQQIKLVRLFIWNYNTIVKMLTNLYLYILYVYMSISASSLNVNW